MPSEEKARPKFGQRHDDSQGSHRKTTPPIIGGGPRVPSVTRTAGVMAGWTRERLCVVQASGARECFTRRLGQAARDGVSRRGCRAVEEQACSGSIADEKKP